MREQELDRLRVALFIGSNAAFYGSLLCSLTFKWDSDIKTAEVNTNMDLKWNPDWFDKLPVNTRKTVMIHEIEHIARLHFNRQGGRDPKRWNEACDHEINNALTDEGYTFDGTNPLCDRSYSGMSAEEIYNHLESQNKEPNPDTWGEGEEDGDMGEGEGNGEAEQSASAMTNMLNTVVKAHQVASMSDNYSNSKSKAITEVLNRFLKPKVNWRRVLRDYFTIRAERLLTWKKPNRRYTEFYLPTRQKSGQSLQHIMFFSDTSGSVSTAVGEIINSELHYISKTFNPDKMTAVQFDTEIHKEEVFLKDTVYKNTEIVGRGGTCLECVRDHIIKNKPTVVVILSDLWCEPMEAIRGVDIVWIVVDNPNARVNQGKLIHITEKGE